MKLLLLFVLAIGGRRVVVASCFPSSQVFHVVRLSDVEVGGRGSGRGSFDAGSADANLTPSKCC